MIKYKVPFTRDTALGVMETARSSARLFYTLAQLSENRVQREAFDAMTDEEIRRFLLFGEQYRRFFGAVPVLKEPKCGDFDSLSDGIRLAAENALASAECLLCIFAGVSDSTLKELCLRSILEEEHHLFRLTFLRNS